MIPFLHYCIQQKLYKTQGKKCLYDAKYFSYKYTEILLYDAKYSSYIQNGIQCSVT